VNISIAVAIDILLLIIFLPTFIGEAMGHMFGYDETFLGSYITGAVLLAYTMYLVVAMGILNKLTFVWLP